MCGRHVRNLHAGHLQVSTQLLVLSMKRCQLSLVFTVIPLYTQQLWKRGIFIFVMRHLLLIAFNIIWHSQVCVFGYKSFNAADAVVLFCQHLSTEASSTPVLWLLWVLAKRRVALYACRKQSKKALGVKQSRHKAQLKLFKTHYTVICT